MSNFKGITEPLGLSKCTFVQSSPKVGRVLGGELAKMTEVVPLLLL